MKIDSGRFKQLAVAAARAADGKKGEAIVLLDLRQSAAGPADFLLIASGNSNVHLRTLREAVEEALDEEEGLDPLHRDGVASDQWVVLDYGGLMVHLLHESVRGHYSLERLWEDAKKVRWADGAAVLPSRSAGTRRQGGSRRGKTPAQPKRKAPRRP